MKRRSISPRSNWPHRLESLGFLYHSTPEPYWDESGYYEFDDGQIDVLEQAANDLQELCLEAVEHIIREDLFERFQVPEGWRAYIAESWDKDEPTIYGRFDFGYDGVGAPKLLEYNADTPTALLEAAVIQWYWLQDVSPRDDQFNSIHECLIEAWKSLRDTFTETLYFTSVADSVEDQITVHYLRDTATQAGLETAYLPINEVGWDKVHERFVDMANRPMRHVFKLYPWEWLRREQFGPFILKKSTSWYEPPWKMLLSNKALLPLLWEMFPGHPNLLRAEWEPFGASYVRKPCLSREGANIQVVIDGAEFLHTGGAYEGPHVYQEVFPLPRHDGNYPVLGCWIVGNVSCGMGIRESKDMITRNNSRFVPHLFKPRAAGETSFERT